MIDWNGPTVERKHRDLLIMSACFLCATILTYLALVATHPDSGTEAISWTGVGLGVIVMGLLYAVDYTTLGNQIDEWNKRSGKRGTLAVILLGLLVFGAMYWTFKPATSFLRSCFLGSVSVLAVIPSLQLLHRISDDKRQRPT
jgi:hypothetical protein